jgi:Cytochrome P460
MRRITLWLGLTIAVGLAVLSGRTITAQDTSDEKYTVQVPNGLAFSEFRGYERWQVVSISHTGEQVMAAILANPMMIDAYKAGIPGNGQPFPDGAMMAKIHWGRCMTSTSW